MAPGNRTDLENERRILQQRLAQLSPKERLEALVQSDDAKAQIRRTPAEDLYFAVMEVGLADAVEVVRLTSPKQFQSLVDLAIWKKDRPDLHELLSWLRAARGDEDEDTLAKLGGLDAELLELTLRQFTTIHDLGEEHPDPQVEGVSWTTPDGAYLVEFNVEGVELSALRSILNDLFSNNPLEASRLLEAVRWEMVSELEENSFRFRTARLADLGFPDIETASSLYTFVKPQTVARPAGTPAIGAAALARSGERVDFLSAALMALDPDERETFESELRHLVNSALVADGAEPGDVVAIRSVSERSRDYLALGLELLSGGDPAQAVEVVRLHPSKRIFQVGFSLTLELKYRVDRLYKRPGAVVEKEVMVLPEELFVLEALHSKRPLKAVKVEGAEPMPFRALREIGEALANITRAEHQVTLFSALLGADAAAKLASVSYGEDRADALRVLTAAVCWCVLDGVPTVAPIPSLRSVELGQKLFGGAAEAPVLKDDAKAVVVSVLTGLVPEDAKAEVQRVGERVLERLRQEAGAAFLGAGSFDPALTEVLPLEP